MKAFILSISLAVLFTTLLVSGNTIAMSIRERIREIAMMRSPGFTPPILQALFVGETATVTFCRWIFGTIGAYGLVFAIVHSQAAGPFAVLLKIPLSTLAVSLSVAGLVALGSAAVSSHRASRVNIVHRLRHIG